MQPTSLPPPQPQSAPLPTAGNDDQVHPADYGFILNPAPPPPKKLIVSTQSPLIRIAVVAGGLLVLLMVFVVLKSALSSSGSSLSSLIAVAQDQQELIHLATGASTQTGLATSTLNSTATIEASITSAQKQLATYLKTNKQKISTQQLNLKVSTSVDAQLTAAASAGTYDQTYQSVMKATLTAYTLALKQAYAQEKGPKGRALLNADFNGAQLLIQQLSNGL